MAHGVPEFTLPDRLVCGRIRMSAQSSTRNDDLRRTPVSRLEWVMSDDGQNRDRYRGILTRSDRTKTLARHWACSMLACTPANDGWLECTIGLLQQAHADGFESDDYLGRKPTSDRRNWLPCPTDGPSDTCYQYVRLLMSEFNDSLGPRDSKCFTTQEILDFRCHGAKPTLTSLTTHLEIDRR